VQCWQICSRCTGFVAMTTVPNAKFRRVLVLAVDIACEGYNVKDVFTGIVIISSHNNVVCAIAE